MRVSFLSVSACVLLLLCIVACGEENTPPLTFSPAYEQLHARIPTVYINMDGTTESITKDTYMKGRMAIISEVHGDLYYEFGSSSEGVKGRGNSSWHSPKKSCNIKFNKKQALIGFPKAKKWCLISNYYDLSLLRNAFASYLATDILNKEWNPHFEFVDLVMNGVYLGNYLLGEKITLTNGRIDFQDIADLEEKELAFGSFIIEFDFLYGSDGFKTGKGLPIVIKSSDDVSDTKKAYIQNTVNYAESILYADDFSDRIDNKSKWMLYIDADSVIDWYLVNEFAKNLDSPFTTSVYMYYNPVDKKLHMGPCWDFDHAFGNWRYRNMVENPEGWWTRVLDRAPVNWIHRMFEDALFCDMVKDRWNEVKDAVQYSVYNDIQSLADKIALSAERNFSVWEILGTDVTGSSAYGWEERIIWQDEVDFLIEWCKSRYAWLDEAMNDKNL